MELRQNEIAVQFAINAGKQIQMERRSDAQAVVIGIEHLRSWLDQVGAEQQRITRTQNAAYSAQEFGIRGAIEISDRASQKQHQQLLARAAVVGHFKKSVEILA